MAQGHTAGFKSRSDTSPLSPALGLSLLTWKVGTVEPPQGCEDMETCVWPGDRAQCSRAQPALPNVLQWLPLPMGSEEHPSPHPDSTRTPYHPALRWSDSSVSHTSHARHPVHTCPSCSLCLESLPLSGSWQHVSHSSRALGTFCMKPPSSPMQTLRLSPPLQT